MRQHVPTFLSGRALLSFAFLGMFLASNAIEAETQVPRSPERYFFQQGFGDYQEELATALKEGRKGVLIMFVQDECPFCAKMEARVLNQPAVQDYFRKNFRIFQVDIYASQDVTDFSGRELPQRKFALNYRARLTPTFVFIGPDGQELTRFVGFADEDTFLKLGQFVASGAYKETNFMQYKRAQGQKS
ncbi:thioredoxin family protein [Thermithiobacillus plumbiphilus]|uniref:Thioredoxin family protein n=1 Tax=Thermithiobacillus plumbiphilus TaxID=1729899 RepID=A0ABU9D4X5_9PROT